jgi:hypothetical protein
VLGHQVGFRCLAPERKDSWVASLIVVARLDPRRGAEERKTLPQISSDSICRDPAFRRATTYHSFFSQSTVRSVAKRQDLIKLKQ